MELAIPLVALGGMYVISNQDKVKAADPDQQRKNILFWGEIESLCSWLRSSMCG